MRVGILGSGLMGGKLGTIFARAGHEVVFSYARSEQKLEEARTGGQGQGAGRHTARGGAGRGRGIAGRALVPGRRCAETGRRLVGEGGRNLLAADERGQHRARRRPRLVGRGGACQEDSEGSRRRGIQHRARAKCCSACTKLGARPAARASCIAATTGARKEVTAGLIRDAGFDPVDAGPLRIARYTEPFALLVAQLAYEGTGGPELAYRFELFRPTRQK